MTLKPTYTIYFCLKECIICIVSNGLHEDNVCTDHNTNTTDHKQPIHVAVFHIMVFIVQPSIREVLVFPFTEIELNSLWYVYGHKTECTCITDLFHNRHFHLSWQEKLKVWLMTLMIAAAHLSYPLSYTSEEASTWAWNSAIQCSEQLYDLNMFFSCYEESKNLL